MSKPRISGECDKCGGNHDFITFNRFLGFICYSCARQWIIDTDKLKNKIAE